MSPPGPWDSFTQTDGLVVTGQSQSTTFTEIDKANIGPGANPASAHATAEAAVKAFDQL